MIPTTHVDVNYTLFVDVVPSYLQTVLVAVSVLPPLMKLPDGTARTFGNELTTHVVHIVLCYHLPKQGTAGISIEQVSIDEAEMAPDQKCRQPV